MSLGTGLARARARARARAVAANADALWPGRDELVAERGGLLYLLPEAVLPLAGGDLEGEGAGRVTVAGGEAVLGAADEPGRVGWFDGDGALPGEVGLGDQALALEQAGDAGVGAAVGGVALEGGAQARAGLAYVPDTADAFPELSVRELIDLVAALRGVSAPPEALRERLGLTAVWHQRLATLSFGQVKRTYLLAALTGSPPLLILDEPSNGLDPEGAAMLAALLHERAAAGAGAVVATNDAGFAASLGGTRHRLAHARLTAEV